MRASQNSLLPSSQKTSLKPFKDVLAKGCTIAKVTKKIEERHHFTLKVHSQVLKNFWQLKVFRNDEKWFLLHLKSSFRSQDI